jgi:hypothetical protein
MPVMRVLSVLSCVKVTLFAVRASLGSPPKVLVV